MLLQQLLPELLCVLGQQLLRCCQILDQAELGAVQPQPPHWRRGLGVNLRGLGAVRDPRAQDGGLHRGQGRLEGR